MERKGRNNGWATRPAAKAAAAALLACLLAGPLRAADGKPGSVFDFGAGARPLAMGGSYGAVARDASALYYNPAGLGLMQNRNFSLMHAQLFEGASYDYFSYAQNFPRLPGAWAGQLLRLGISGVEGRDEFNVPTSNISYSETALSVGAGFGGVFYPGLSAGLAAKVLHRDLAGSADNLFGFDAGLRYGPVYGDRLNLSLTLQNLGAFATGDTADRLPFSARAGASFLVAGGLLLSADVSSDGALRVGSEYAMGPAAFRAGYGLGSVSFGAGLKFLKAYSLDLAMARTKDLGLSNRISMSYMFGAGSRAKPRSELYAKDYLAQAEKALAAAEWVKASDAIAMAMGLDTALRNGPWAERRLRLAGLVNALRLRELPERGNVFKGGSPASDEAALAAREYVEGRTARSILFAHSAAGYEPDSSAYQELLKALSVLDSRDVVKDEVLPRPMLIKAKLGKADAAFYGQDFKRTVAECSAVLLIDEGNAEAWKKLGSAYYALGDNANARRAYERVISLNPQDAAVIKFMGLQGWR